MSDDERSAATADAPRKTYWGRHPKLSILLIAGVFYVSVLGMCLFTLVVILAR